MAPGDVVVVEDVAGAVGVDEIGTMCDCRGHRTSWLTESVLL